MKNKFLLLSLVATVFCSCSNDEVLVETTTATNAIETSNLEPTNAGTSTDETSRVVSLVGPARISANVNGKFRVTISASGNRRVEWFIGNVLVRTQLTAGNVADFGITPNDFAMPIGSTITVSVRQKETTRKVSTTFVVGSNDPFFN